MNTSTDTDYVSALLAGHAEDQFLLFQLGDETFGVSVHEVEEIRSSIVPTRVPGTPDFILGIANLRGTIVPIVDLRTRFGIVGIRRHDADITVILKVAAEDRTRTIGLMVDDVVDVCPLPGDLVKPPPDLGSAIRTEFIQGIATLSDAVVVVLRTARLFNLDELSRLDESSEKGESKA